jgi:transketolase
MMNEGTDVSIFATGHLVYHALEAAYLLSQQGVSAEVIDIHTIKPLDKAAIINSVTKTKCVVTAEEHLLNGGMGDSVCQLLSRNYPAPVEMVGVDDVFGESGKPKELMKMFGLDTNAVLQAALRVIARK